MDQVNTPVNPEDASQLHRSCVLEGTLVGLAKLRREDIPTMTRWFQNLEYSAYLGTFGFAATVEDETAWFERNAIFQPNEAVQFAIIELATGQHVGNCGLFDIHRPSDTATLGIGIGEPTCWGKGFGTEAVRLLVEYGMFFLNLWHIKLFHTAWNERGHRAYQKAGFREVGRLTKSIRLGHERFDEVIMEITRDDVDLSRIRAKLRLLTDSP